MSTRILALTGGVRWLVVMLTHVAERLRLLPSMGWGQKNSAGHYLDLISAVAGALLMVAAFLVRSFASRDNGQGQRPNR